MSTLSSDGIHTLLEELGVDGTVPAFDAADIQNDPIDIFISHLASTLTELTGCSPQVAYQSILCPNELSDLVVVIPRLQLEDKNSKAVAAQLKPKFPPSHLLLRPVNDGIHLRFYFSQLALARVLLPYIIDRGSSYGGFAPSSRQSSEPIALDQRKIVVEFSSPNIGREFDGLHLRSTILGGYLATLYEAMGWKVTRMNFLGDWGQPLGLLAAGWSRFGSEEAMKTNPLRHLLDVYTQIEGLSKEELRDSQDLSVEPRESVISSERDSNLNALENGDDNAISLWKRFRDVSIEEYTQLYARLNIKFDDYSGEAEVKRDTIAEVELSLQDRLVFDEEKDGWIVDFSVHETRALKSGHAKIRNRKGTTTYLLRDVAAAIDRNEKYDFDKLIYVVSARQDSHFQQLFAVLELVGHSELAAKLQHVSFNAVKGFRALEESSGLLLSDALDRSQSAIAHLLANQPSRFPYLSAAENIQLHDGLGCFAVGTQVLAARRKEELVLDFDNFDNLEEASGLDLQNCLSNLDTRLRNFKADREILKNANYSLLEDESYASYAEVLRTLIQFPATVKASFEKLESSSILTYLFRLTAQLEGIWYGEAESESSTACDNTITLVLYEAARQVLSNGMCFLGLRPLESQPVSEASDAVSGEEAEELITADNVEANVVGEPQPQAPEPPVGSAEVSPDLSRVVEAAGPVSSAVSNVVDDINTLPPASSSSLSADAIYHDTPEPMEGPQTDPKVQTIEVSENVLGLSADATTGADSNNVETTVAAPAQVLVVGEIQKADPETDSRVEAEATELAIGEAPKAMCTSVSRAGDDLVVHADESAPHDPPEQRLLVTGQATSIEAH